MLDWKTWYPEYVISCTSTHVDPVTGWPGLEWRRVGEGDKLTTGSITTHNIKFLPHLGRQARARGILRT